MAAAAFQLIKTLAGIVLLGATLSAQTDPGPVNVADRESARTWFNTWWPKTHGADMGFTGNVDAGVPGTTSQAYRDQILLRLNMHRRMAGELPVTEDATATTKAQAAAVLNAVNGDLSHNPPATWKFYTALGAEGSAGSSLEGQTGPEGVSGLIDDGGGKNMGLGHRVDLLEPQLTAVGIGNSPPATNSPIVRGVEAIYTQQLLSITSRFSEPVILWPRGYVPAFLVPGRWSISIGDAFLDATLDLSAAEVVATKSGAVLPIKQWRTNGGGSVVFTLDGTDEGNTGYTDISFNEEQFFSMPLPSMEAQYHITVSKIKVRATGALWNSSGVYEYDVVPYNPSLGSLIQGKSSDLANISTRSFAGAGSSTQIAGFISSGSASRKVLIRAGGPWLAQFAVGNVLADPVLTLYEGQSVIGTNDDWSENLAEVSAAVAKAGAISFAANSKDAALVATLKPSISYTAQVTGKGSATGNAIVELYDIDAGSESRLINISTRSFVGTGASIQIGGFILRGNGPRKVLIRASGPYLMQFRVDNVLTDPVLNVFKGQDLIATNDDWSSDVEEINSATNAAGVTPFAAGSKDAAIVLILDPNVPYTAQVSGKANGTGNALIEVYALP